VAFPQTQKIAHFIIPKDFKIKVVFPNMIVFTKTPMFEHKDSNPGKVRPLPVLSFFFFHYKKSLCIPTMESLSVMGDN
jgi:hypothetical protein